MSWPNVLTLSRVILAFFITGLLLGNTPGGCIAAFLLFIVASFTDFYDGYLARRYGLISDFGKIMDPIADKILVLAVFGVLSYLGMAAWWMVAAIALREVVVTVSRLNAMAKGQVLGAEALGKLKTVFQMASIILILIFLIVEQSVFAQNWFYKVDLAWRGVIHVCMLITVVLTMVSGLIYFRNKCQ